MLKLWADIKETYPQYLFLGKIMGDDNIYFSLHESLDNQSEDDFMNSSTVCPETCEIKKSSIDESKESPIANGPPRPRRMTCPPEFR